jgi:hypothetical protein
MSYLIITNAKTGRVEEILGDANEAARYLGRSYIKPNGQRKTEQDIEQDAEELS